MPPFLRPTLPNSSNGSSGVKEEMAHSRAQRLAALPSLSQELNRLPMLTVETCKPLIRPYTRQGQDPTPQDAARRKLFDSLHRNPPSPTDAYSHFPSSAAPYNLGHVDSTSTISSACSSETQSGSMRSLSYILTTDMSPSRSYSTPRIDSNTAFIAQNVQTLHYPSRRRTNKKIFTLDPPEEEEEYEEGRH